MQRNITPPRGVFVGKNFMTPDILEYGRVRLGVWYEISKGRGFTGTTIYGVTIRPYSAKSSVSKLSKMVNSVEEALEYLREVSVEGAKGEY